MEPAVGLGLLLKPDVSVADVGGAGVTRFKLGVFLEPAIE